MQDKKTYYIPWFVESSLMESRIMWEKMKGSTALTLKQVLAMIMEGFDGREYTFQSIDSDGLIENVYPDEVLSWFGGWVMLSEGVIIQYSEHLKDMPKLTTCKIGYSQTEKFTICPISSELLEQIHESVFDVVNSLKFKIVQYEDLEFLSHLTAEDELEEL